MSGPRRLRRAPWLIRAPWLVLVAAVVALAAWPAPIAGAQAAAGTTVVVTNVDGTAYPTVRATVTLPRGMADGSSDLELQVEEEGSRARPVTTATPAKDDELRVVLLIDTSGSMTSNGAIASAKDAAQAFVDQLPPTAQIAVVGFGDEPEVASPLTVDRSELTRAIGDLEARGETALYDGVVAALGQLPSEGRARRHVIVLSDGYDTASATGGLDAAATAVAASGARLDVVQLETDENDPAALRRLADAGHGAVAAVDDPDQLTAIYAGFADSLANEYQIEFQATDRSPVSFRVGVVVDGVLDRTSAVAVAQAPGAPIEAPTSTPVPAPAPPSPGASAVIETGWISGSGALVIGVGCCLLAAALVASVWVAREPQRRARLGPARSRPTTPREAVTAAVQRFAEVADRSLERHGRRGRLNAELERAGLALKPGEVVLMGVGAVVVSGLVLTLVLGPVVGFIGAVLAGVGSVSTVTGLARRRQRLFADQLSDNLVLMAGTLRTGYAILPALDMVSREAPSPSAEEFRRVVTESRLGRDLNTSLAAMADRVGGDDFTWVAQAIEINREVGGDLAEVLDNVSSTIRERARVRRQVRTVSAEGRTSALVLVALPFVMALLLAIVNPEYLSELGHGAGLVMLLVGGVLLVIGSLWTRRLVKVKF